MNDIATPVNTQGSHQAPLRDLRRLLSLKSDQADADVIDATVRDSARLAGTNLWVLVLAMLVASIGLNVNSTAVIIGAMLISPLMGPIIGVGYGAGVHDYRLIRSALWALAIFVTISLLSSTAYFALSPLTQAHSEILARTSPTLWDVLIAFFGGAAGMIGLTRKEKTTLIPGVAIATALMPPLCTAGYGLATGQPRIALGAFYLFTINAVFIALATFVIARLLQLPQRAPAVQPASAAGRIVLSAIVLAVLVPSVVLASRLVREEVFLAKAERFVLEVERSSRDVAVLRQDIDARQRVITLTLLGKGVSPELERVLAARIESAPGLAGTALRIRHPSEDVVAVDTLRRDLRRELLKTAMGAVEAQSARIDRLEKAHSAAEARAADLVAAEAEIRSLVGGLRHVLVTRDATRVWVVVEPSSSLGRAATERIGEWARTRWPDAEVRLVIGRTAI